MNRRWLKSLPGVARVNAACKGWWQEQQAAAAVRYYRREVASRPWPCPQGASLTAAVRTRLARRTRGRWPKPRGELHLFLACAVHNWETILPQALAPFGRVTCFDWHALGFDDRAPDWLERRREMNAQMLDAFHAANRIEPIDAVVGYLSGDNTDPLVLREMAQTGAAIFNFCWDDKLRFPGPLRGGRHTSPAALAAEVDLNLTNAPDSVVKYAAHGGLAMFWPEAAHPEFHRPHDVAFDFDVSFAGSNYGWRGEFIAQLRANGMDVECFGAGWPNGPLDGAELVRLYSRSRINLGFGGVGYARRLVCLKNRDFEVPMSGGLYLTQHNPELARVFEIGTEILTWRDAADCARQIRELLAQPARAEALRRAGRARCLRDHTYEARWSQVFQLAGLLGAQRSEGGVAIRSTVPAEQEAVAP